MRAWLGVFTGLMILSCFDPTWASSLGKLWVGSSILKVLLWINFPTCLSIAGSHFLWSKTLAGSGDLQILGLTLSQPSYLAFCVSWDAPLALCVRWLDGFAVWLELKRGAQTATLHFSAVSCGRPSMGKLVKGKPCLPTLLTMPLLNMDTVMCRGYTQTLEYTVN